MVGISGSGKVAAVSVMVYGWQLSLYVSPRYCYISFIVIVNFSDAIGPRSKVQPSKSVHRPWKSVLVLGSGLGLFWCFLPLYILVLEACPLFLSVGIFNSLPSGGKDGFNLTVPPPFLNIFCSYVEFAFCVYRYSHGLIKMEICINTLPSSLLDRQE